MKKLFVLIVFLAVVLCAVNAFAAAQTIAVTATVPSTSGLSVTINKVVGSTWTTASSIAFGNLVWNSTASMFLPSDGGYYVVDVDVTNNATSWTLTHNRTPLAFGTNKLDSNVNVSFYKQTSSSVGTLLSKLSFDASNNQAFTKTALSGAWLRIYYGIATGSSDATGVTPIGATAAAGTYTGSVTLTLA
jgi:hypothetical protein